MDKNLFIAIMKLVGKSKEIFLKDKSKNVKD